MLLASRPGAGGGRHQGQWWGRYGEGGVEGVSGVRCPTVGSRSRRV